MLVTDWKQLHRAVLNAFNLASFDRLLWFELDRKREHYSTSSGFIDIVFEVIQSAENEGWLENLIEKALQANPTNRKLRKAILENISGAESLSLQSWQHDWQLQQHEQALVKLLPKSVVFTRLLREAYQIVRPQFYIDTIIPNVDSAQIPQLIHGARQIHRGVPVLELAHHAKQSVDAQTAQQIDQWIETMRKALGISTNIKYSTDSSSPTFKWSHLMVKVEGSDPNGKRYNVEMYVSNDNGDWERCPGNLDHTVRLQQLPELIFDVLSDYFENKPEVIELFLPHKLMVYDFDQWGVLLDERTGDT